MLFIFTPLFDGTIPWFSNQNASIGLFNNSEIDSKTWKYYQTENLASRNFPNANEDEIKFRAWYQMISDTIYNLELNKVGVGVTNAEFNEGILNGENLSRLSLKSNLLRMVFLIKKNLVRKFLNEEKTPKRTRS